MSDDRWLRDRPPIARGDAPAGRWELRVDSQDDGHGEWLRLFIDFQDEHGQPVGGFGCSGIGLANDGRPVVVSVSGDRPAGAFCYVGQTVLSTTRVEVELSDGSVTDAALVHSELPAIIWVAFTGVSSWPNEIRAFAVDDLLGRESLEQPNPRCRGSSVWGPIDWVA